MKEKFLVVDGAVIVTSSQLRELYMRTDEYRRNKQAFGNGFCDYPTWREAQIEKGIFKIAEYVLDTYDISDMLKGNFEFPERVIPAI